MVAWTESIRSGIEPVEVRGEGMGLWVEPTVVEVTLGTLLRGLTALYVELAVVCMTLGNSDGPESVALCTKSSCADVGAGPVVLRAGLVAEWPLSATGGTLLTRSTWVESGYTSGLGPGVGLFESTASTASVRAASTLASLMWLRVRL